MDNKEFDYQIKIFFDRNCNPYWQLIKKGEVVIANKQEKEIVLKALQVLSAKIEYYEH